MLQAQQDSFDMEAMSQSSERSLRDDAAEGTAATTCTLEACSDVHENGDGNDLPPRSHSRWVAPQRRGISLCLPLHPSRLVLLIRRKESHSEVKLSQASIT